MDGVETPFETSDISDHEEMLNGNSDSDVEEDGTLKSPFEPSDISDHEDMLNGNSDSDEEDGTSR